MPSLTPPAPMIRFGDFEVDLPAGRLRKGGLKVRLPEQSFQVLSILLQHAGELVTRNELRHRLWPGRVYVDFDANLNTAVARLREVLNDPARKPRYVETLPKRGYLFVASFTEATSTTPRLLVLPFDNLSGEPAQEYFSDAMTEEMIRLLAKLAPEKLAVLARSTAMRFKGREKNIAHIGRDLAIDYFVEGSVSRVDDRLSVSIHLLRAGSQTHIWTNRYDAPMSDLFGLESAAAQAIAAQLGIATSCAARKPANDLEAYSFYVQGRHHSAKVTPEGFAKAQHFFKQAIERDPEFALAYDGLAELHYYLGFTGFLPPKEVLSTGLFYALRAVEIDNTLAETHALLGHFRKQLDYDWAEIRREMGRALELNPASPDVRVRYAMNGLMPHGLIDESIAEIERALKFDPLSLRARVWLGAMCWLGRHFERGLEEMRSLLSLDAEYYMAYFVMGQNYAGKGLYEEALATHQKAVALSGGAPLMLGWPGIPLGRMGRTAEIRSMLDQLHSIARKTFVPPTAFAWAHLGLREIDKFFEAMNLAIDARDHMLTGIKSYWFLDEIRSDQRYLGLLKRMNLTP